MRWSDVGNLVKNGAPLIAALLTAPASVPVAIISLIAGAFGLKSDSSPEEVYKAIETDKEADYKLSKLQLEYHDQIEKLLIAAERNQSNNIHREILSEYSLDSKFKSYWRPSFGYMLVFLIPIIVLWLITIASCVFFWQPDKLGLLQSILGIILTPISSLLTWCIGVLGVNIYHRSKDKGALLGTEKKSLMDIFK